MASYKLVNYASDLWRISRWVWENNTSKKDLALKQFLKILEEDAAKKIMADCRIVAFTRYNWENSLPRKRLFFAEQLLVASNRLMQLGLN